MTNKWLSLTDIPLLPPKVADGTVWQHAVYLLSRPPDNPVSQFGLVVHRLRWLILVEMVRSKWDPKFCKGQVRHKDKKGCELEGLFWRRVLDLAIQVHAIEGGDLHPALWFAQVFNEHSLGVTIRKSGINTKKESFAEIRQQNKALLTLDSNPALMFEGEATKALLELAFKYADTGIFGSPDIQQRRKENRFRAEYYTPFVKARMAVTTYRANDSLIFKKRQDGRALPTRQGRRATQKL